MYFLILIFLVTPPTESSASLQELRKEISVGELTDCKTLQAQSGFITSQGVNGIYVGSFCEWRKL